MLCARLAVGWCVLAAGTIRAAAPTGLDFERNIRPVLSANCSECHSDKTKTSGFSVASLDAVVAGGNKHGRAVLPGDPASSPLVKILKGELAPRMPFGKSLAAADIASIEQWIRQLKPTAAHAPEQWRWPFERPKKSEPPVVRQTA